MRVLVVTGLYPPEIGGPATYARLLELGLPPKGISIDVVPFREVRKYPRIIRHLVYFWLLVKRARHADVIFALDPISVGIPALCASFIRRKKFVIKIVGDYAWEQARQRFGFTGALEEFQSAPVGVVSSSMRILQHVVTRTADACIVPSEYLARIVRGWGVKKVSVIYNGVSVGDIGTKETIRGVLHFNGRLIVSVGRLVPWKGFEMLIKVFAEVAHTRPDLKLFIVGDGPLLESLQLTVDSLQLGDRVVFAGAVHHDALLRYLRAADIFVLNTLYEGFSHLILEALAVGMPIVTTRVGGNPEVIEDGISGYLLPPDDGDALKKTLTKLLDNSELRTEFAARARVRAAQFSDARTLAETAAFIKRV